MKHAVTRQLHAYWSVLRGSRSAPERKDIDPAAIRDILRDTFILEVDGSGRDMQDYPIRISGTRLNALQLRELKGEAFRSLWLPAEQRHLLGLMAAVADDRMPLVAGLRAGPEGHRPIDFELLLLPLRHVGRTHARMLGALVPVEVPSWLGLLPVQPFSTVSHRMVTEEVPDNVRVLPLPNFRAPKRYGPLVLHYGGR